MNVVQLSSPIGLILPDSFHRVQHWAGAAFMGLISTALAKGAHDLLIDPVPRKRQAHAGAVLTGRTPMSWR